MILQHPVPHSTGWSGEIKQTHIIRINATTTVDLFSSSCKKLLEAFDQPDLAVGGNSVDVMIYQP